MWFIFPQLLGLGYSAMAASADALRDIDPDQFIFRLDLVKFFGSDWSSPPLINNPIFAPRMSASGAHHFYAGRLWGAYRLQACRLPCLVRQVRMRTASECVRQLIHLNQSAGLKWYIVVNSVGDINVRTQTIRSHFAVWPLLLLAVIVLGFFMMTVKPAAQAPVPEINSQSEPIQLK